MAQAYAIQHSCSLKELILFSTTPVAGKEWVDDLMTERLLDLSRLQTGRIIPQKRFINCRSFAAAQIGLYQGMAAKKEIAIINDIPEGMKVYADPDLFGECVKNVLSNALKFCDKGDTVTFFNFPDPSTNLQRNDAGGELSGVHAGGHPETLSSRISTCR